MRYIQSRYLILENVNKTKKHIEKLEQDGLPQDILNKYNETLNILKDMLKSNPNLIYNFFLYHVNDNIPVKNVSMDERNINSFHSSLENLYKYIQNNKQKLKKLPKSLDKYTKVEELFDDITTLNTDSDIEKFIKNLYPEFRKELELTAEVKSIIRAFNDLDDDKKALMPPQKYFKANGLSVNDYISELDKIINSDNNKELLLTSIKAGKYNSDTEVVYNENNIVVVRSYDKEFLADWGSSKWCIVYAMESYYDNYVSPLKGHTQYFIFDYNKPENDPSFKYGISIENDGSAKFGGCQNALNKPIALSSLIDNLNLPKDILIPHVFSVDDMKANFTANERIGTPYFDESEILQLSPGVRYDNGYFSHISDEELDEEFLKNIKRLSAYSGDSEEEKVLVKKFLERNKENLINFISKYPSKLFVPGLSVDWIKEILGDELYNIDTEVKLNNKNYLRSYITDEEYHSIPLETRLRNIDYHSFITDDEIMNLDKDDIISHSVYPAFIKRKDEFSVHDIFRFYERTERYGNSVNLDKMLEGKADPYKLPIKDKLEIIEIDPDFEELVFEPEQLEEFLTIENPDYEVENIELSGTNIEIELNNEYYQGILPFYKEVYGLDDNDASQIINGEANEPDGNDELNYIHYYISEENIEIIKKLADIFKFNITDKSGDIDEGKVYKLFNSTPLDEDIISDFIQSLIWISYEYKNGIISDMEDYVFNTSGNTVEISIEKMIELSEKYDFNFNTVGEFLENLPSIEDSINKDREDNSENGEYEKFDIYALEYGLQINDDDEEGNKLQSKLKEKLENELEILEEEPEYAKDYFYVLNKLDKLGFVKDERYNDTKYEYKSDDVEITIYVSDIDFIDKKMKISRTFGDNNSETMTIGIDDLYTELNKNLFERRRYF